MKTFWLSFCDSDRPKGQQFLGACVLDVADSEAESMLSDLTARFPNHQPGAEWIAAALKKAWALGCNPGGEVATSDVTAADPKALAHYERGQLYSRAEIDAIDAEIESAAAGGVPPEPPQ